MSKANTKSDLYLKIATTQDLQARFAVLKAEIRERKQELLGIKAELEERDKVERARAAVAAMTPAERSAQALALAEAKQAEKETDQ